MLVRLLDVWVYVAVGVSVRGMVRKTGTIGGWDVDSMRKGNGSRLLGL